MNSICSDCYAHNINTASLLFLCTVFYSYANNESTVLLHLCEQSNDCWIVIVFDLWFFATIDWMLMFYCCVYTVYGVFSVLFAAQNQSHISCHWSHLQKEISKIFDMFVFRFRILTHLDATQMTTANEYWILFTIRTTKHTPHHTVDWINKNNHHIMEQQCFLCFCITKCLF